MRSVGDVGRADTGDLLVERLLQVIDEGRRTATYKLALLAGLIDAVAMAPGRRRSDPARRRPGAGPVLRATAVDERSGREGPERRRNAVRAHAMA